MVIPTLLLRTLWYINTVSRGEMMVTNPSMRFNALNNNVEVKQTGECI